VVGIVVLAVGVASAVLGVLYALMEHDLKRLLAFHSIENVGIILIGVGVAMLAAGAGSGPLAPSRWPPPCSTPSTTPCSSPRCSWPAARSRSRREPATSTRSAAWRD